MMLSWRLRTAFERRYALLSRLRAVFYHFPTGLRFKSLGRAAKIRGASAIQVGKDFVIGDFCWIEAVRFYENSQYHPRLKIGDRVAMSDLVHISCAESIQIEDDCLIGSKVYIGDHNHGSVRDFEQIASTAPATRPLGDLGKIVIGARTWVGDGAVILAGTNLSPGSIVGANSVVRLAPGRPALVAGIPARVIRYLESATGLDSVEPIGPANLNS